MVTGLMMCHLWRAKFESQAIFQLVQTIRVLLPNFEIFGVREDLFSIFGHCWLWMRSIGFSVSSSYSYSGFLTLLLCYSIVAKLALFYNIK